MNENPENIFAIERAFSTQSSSFDEFEIDNPVLSWMRNRVHFHCMKFYKPGESILELNCGTGIDATFFAEQGMFVYATDLSEGMLKELQKKIDRQNLREKITMQQCSFENLSPLSNGIWHSSNPSDHNMHQQKFNHIFSDFGGLNCTPDLRKVVAQFNSLVEIGGTVTLVIMPKICPWEIALSLKGNLKTAFRRLRKYGALSHLEGEYFTTYYYNPFHVIKMFEKNFQKVALTGLASISPPPYLYEWAKRHPKLYKRLTVIDENLCNYYPFNSWADHFILTMQKTT